MINEKISTGETVVAVLKNAKTGEKRTIDNVPPKTSEDPDRYEITLHIKDRLTGETRKYEVKE